MESTSHQNSTLKWIFVFTSSKKPLGRSCVLIFKKAKIITIFVKVIIVLQQNFLSSSVLVIKQIIFPLRGFLILIF